MAPVYVLHFLLFCHLTLLLLVAEDGSGYQGVGVGECPPSFDCGYVGNISFPFTITQRQDCGLLPIQNCDDPLKLKSIQLDNKGRWFDVMLIVQNPRSPSFASIEIRDSHLYKLLQSKSCEAFTYNYTLPPPPTFRFGSFRIAYNATLFKCNRTLHVSPPTHTFNYTECPDYDLYYYTSFNKHESRSSLIPCAMVQLPIKDVPDATDPFTFVTADSIIHVQLSDECANCHYFQRGQCQPDSNQKFYCANVHENKHHLKMEFGVVIAITITLVLVFVGLYYTRWKKQNPTHVQIEASLERYGPLQTRRYSYSEIKKVTNSFKNKLGQGGFGIVYKGELLDGCHVAVKVLSELKGDGEEFINEVVSISRTSHVNIVTLLGFCLEGSKRALVYEFMSNGSLEKFIFEGDALMVDHQLDCQTLYHIAIGVAKGLEYLHKGCNTRILHFDIKPHNILLDENFCPKISDFGLAKICMRKESMVSIFGARGTAGYIAPEVFSRNFGAVSHKSDVYSYGMMMLEMVGRRKNIKVEVDHSSEIYFPHWIYHRLESNQELGLRDIRNGSDDEKVRKMTIVGLWCIQTHPSTRPTISKVVEMLEGRVESLQMAPKPFLSSPSTSPVHLSCETL